MSEEQAYIYDARGNGEGLISPNLTGDHQNRITDYTAVIVQRNNTMRCNYDGTQLSPTLTERNAGGGAEDA